MKNKFSILLAIILFNFSFVNAQSSEELFNPILENSIDEVKMRGKKDLIEKTKNDKNFKTIDFVKIGDLSKIQINNVLTFNLPKFGKLSAKISQNEYFDEDNYKLVGEFFGKEHGYIYLFNEGGNVYGHIIVENRTFHIKSIDRKISILVETDKTKQKDKICDGIGALKDNGDTKKSNSSLRVLPCTQVDIIRVLVIYTQSALDAVGLQTIQERVNISIAQFNNAYNSSGVTNTRARLVLAGLELTTFTETTNTAGNGNGQITVGGVTLWNEQHDINRLPTTAEARRVATNSDIVLCLTNANYQAGYGIARAINANYADGFATTEILRIPDQPVFPHEIGHLLGGRHPFGTGNGQDSTPGDAHGYQYTVKFGFLNLGRKDYCTLMCPQMPTDVRRSDRWSNPNIQDSGTATGTTANNNVARNISINTDRIANFRPAVNQIQASIIGNSTISSYGNQTYEAGVSCGAGPYTYLWEKSTNGFNYSQVGTGEFYTTLFYPGSNQFIYLRLRITGANGQNSTAFLTVYIPNGSGARIAAPIENPNFNSETNIDKTLSNSGIQKSNENESIIKVIYPNPAKNNIATAINMTSESQIKIELIDNLGTVIETIFNGISKIGEYTYDANLPKLKNGIYYVKVYSGDKISTKRVIIE